MAPKDTSDTCSEHKYEPLPEGPPIPPKRHQPCSEHGKNLNNIPYNLKTKNNNFSRTLKTELIINFGDMVEAQAPLRSKSHFKINPGSMQLGIRG
jgi:hypothetical protein